MLKLLSVPSSREEDITNYWLRAECALVEVPPSNSTVELAYAFVDCLPQIGRDEDDDVQEILQSSTAVASG